MKKSITISLAIVLAFTLVACGGGNSDTPSNAPELNSPSDTPTTRPEQTPETTPDNGGGDPDSDLGVAVESFFPGIDDSLLPDDIVKFTVGTLYSTFYNDYDDPNIDPSTLVPSIVSSGGYNMEITIDFRDVTSNEEVDLREHYKLDANEIITEVEGLLHCSYDWGEIQIRSRVSVDQTLEVRIYYKS